MFEDFEWKKIRKCLPKVNFERFLLLNALRDFLAGLLWVEFGA
jgi:hypothetical protein